MNAKSTIALMLAAGTACAAGDLAPVQMKPADTTSVYVNMSGERIVVDGSTQVLGEATPARIWINNRTDPCGLSPDVDGPDDIPGTLDDDNFQVIWLHAVNEIDPESFRTPDMLLANWGDVPGDTQVNSIGTWVWHDLQAPVDGDPVDGFDLVIGFQDRWNGNVPSNAGAAPALNLTLTDLPDAADGLTPGYVSGFYFVVDLADADPTLDATFELGDTDESGPASGFFNPLSFEDDAGDVSSATGGLGLHDFGYYTTFNFPETGNVGAVTVYTGAFGDVEYGESQGDFFSFVEASANGIATGLDFNSTAVFNSGIDATTGLPVGMADNTNGEFLGYFNFGAIDCNDASGPNDPGVQWLELFFADAVEVCVADFNGDDQVNILDVLAFINAWNAGLDYDGSGQVNILDVLAFINDWNAAIGC